MDVPSLFLINDETSDRGIELGFLVLIAAAVALAALIVKTPVMRTVLLGAGIALIVMSVLFVIQVNRFISMTDTSLTDVLGIGPIILLAASGALVYVAAQLRKQPPPTIGT